MLRDSIHMMSKIVVWERSNRIKFGVYVSICQFVFYPLQRYSRANVNTHFPLYTLLQKKGPRGVRFEGCYSPRSVMATHKGVELTSWGVGRLR